MFGIFHKARRLTNRTTTPRSRLGVDRLESREVPSAAALVGGTLMIKGTDFGEAISVQVNDVRSGGVVNAAVVYSDGAVIGKFAMAGVNRIEIHGNGGNDKIVISDQIKLPALVDGGAGDDSLVAGSGSTVLMGGAGNDMLFGGPNRDILIGGDGGDSLYGNGGEDILIAGRAKLFENDSTALWTLQKQWNGDRSYTTRVDSLRQDLTNVYNDGSVDYLAGGDGMDWFIGGKNSNFSDRTQNEMLN